MDNPVQDIIIGNIPGASAVHPNLVNTKVTVTPNKVSSNQSLHTGILKDNRELSKVVQEPVTKSEICLNTNTFAAHVDNWLPDNLGNMSSGDIIGSGSNTVILFRSLKFTHTR